MTTPPSHTICVVDDDPTIREMVKLILESEGHTIVTAEDGKSALEVLANQATKTPFSLVVLDVLMPGMHGIEVLSKMKESDCSSKLPVLLLTGESRAEDILSGYRVGAEYYITKPFTRQQLLYGVKLLLSNR